MSDQLEQFKEQTYPTQHKPSENLSKLSQYSNADNNGQYKAISYKINELLSQCSRQNGRTQKDKLMGGQSMKSRQSNQEKLFNTIDKPYESVKMVSTDDNTIRKLVEFSLNTKQHKRTSTKIQNRDTITENGSPIYSRKLRVKSAYDDVLSQVQLKNLNKEALLKF